MKKLYSLFLVLLLGGPMVAQAGNPERYGQAGGVQLLINGWSRSSALNGMNIANSMGIESMITNPAGLVMNSRTEIVFAHTRWLEGSEVFLNTFGLNQSIGRNRTNFIAASVTALSLGELIRTTVDQPDGTLVTFSPTMLNISLGYAHKFLDGRINVGFVVKVIHESIPDAQSNAFAFDAGVQYASKNKKFKLGVALRNIGPTARFQGGGLSARANLGGSNSNNNNLVYTAAAPYQLPSVLTGGVSYDFHLGRRDSNNLAKHILTPMVAYYANAYSYDQTGIGLEYSFHKYLKLMFSYMYERGITSKESSRNAHSGIATGASVSIPLSKRNDLAIGIDYSYRTTYWFNGTHTFGARLNL
jgi:hypothetical protein